MNAGSLVWVADYQMVYHGPAIVLSPPRGEFLVIKTGPMRRTIVRRSCARVIATADEIKQHKERT